MPVESPRFEQERRMLLLLTLDPRRIISLAESSSLSQRGRFAEFPTSGRSVGIPKVEGASRGEIGISMRHPPECSYRTGRRLGGCGLVSSARRRRSVAIRSRVGETVPSFRT